MILHVCGGIAAGSVHASVERRLRDLDINALAVCRRRFINIFLPINPTQTREDSYGRQTARKNTYVYNDLAISEVRVFELVKRILVFFDMRKTGGVTTRSPQLSSPGAFGFYRWIDNTQTHYGIVARLDTNPGAAMASLECGRNIRKAFMAGTTQ